MSPEQNEVTVREAGIVGGFALKDARGKEHFIDMNNKSRRSRSFVPNLPTDTAACTPPTVRDAAERGIDYHKAMDKLRAEEKRKPNPEDKPRSIVELARSLFPAQYQAFLARQTQHTRDIAILHYGQGLTLEQTAIATDRTFTAIQCSVTRLRRNLAKACVEWKTENPQE